MTVWPVRSSTRAPAGVAVLPLGPTRVMRVPSMTIVWSSRGGAPVPSMRRACVSATIGASTLTKGRVSAVTGGRDCACDCARATPA